MWCILTMFLLAQNILTRSAFLKVRPKKPFLKVFPHGENWEVIAEDGININKLDKGCLVFKQNRDEGYVVCVVDNTNKQNDAQYWVNDFLQVTRAPTAIIILMRHWACANYLSAMNCQKSLM
jgi:hypothetical protein